MSKIVYSVEFKYNNILMNMAHLLALVPAFHSRKAGSLRPILLQYDGSNFSKRWFLCPDNIMGLTFLSDGFTVQTFKLFIV